MKHVAVILTLLFSAFTARADDRPNIVFLMADDQCTYSMGCYGTPGVKTPNLDQLAADGMIFDRHYDTTAICMASRANVMTGMFEYKTGCNFTHGPLLREHWARTYPMLLRQKGYMTAFAGKFGFEVADKPQTRGAKGISGTLPESDFDHWGGGPQQTHFQTKRNKSMAKYADKYPHSTLSYAAFAEDAIADAASKQKPLCLSISFKAPHRPVQPDPQFNHVYAGATFTKPANYGREHGHGFSKQSRQGRQYERFHSWNYSAKYDEVMAKYYQQIYAIDVAVGRIRESLKKHGVEKNTVVIYTSDNGFLCGSHGYGSKVLPYEEASRVPLIMFDPRHENSGKQLRCNALTGNVDFAPTILALAGLPRPDNMDGQNLMPLYDNPNGSVHESLPLINVWGPRTTHSLSVVTQGWKYIYWPFAGEGFEATEELYHLAKDPLELKNLADDETSQTHLVRMRQAYDNAHQKWKKERVDYHGYAPYDTAFDRSKKWPTQSR
ncbi:MAG: sulfatase [Planctomycetaceae bacterium]